jgi:aminoglycoside phosphotransferase family enzyme/predicted kinase
MIKFSASYSSAIDERLMLIKALNASSVYGHPVESISVIETHISWVLLTGKYAYKIKKPVDFGFLDFSTLEKRRFFCEEEIRLNRRLAQQHYLSVVAITGTMQNPKINGDGIAIEYAVKMLQFSDGHLLSDLAEKGELGLDIIDRLTNILADFHESISSFGQESEYGDRFTIKQWFNENFAQIEPLLTDDINRQQLHDLKRWGINEWNARNNLMQQRKQQGHVRECHGDLHLGNITLIDGVVTPFDCIEFNPSLRWIDTMNEIAFLVMDLFRYGYENLAFRLLNQYLQITGDYEGITLLRYYFVYRAMVRAKVDLLRLQQSNEDVKKNGQNNFNRYIDLAERFTKADKPLLLLTHGFSGSGKSTYAKQLAEEFHALQIRSDTERKRLFGYKAHDKTGSGIADGVYSEWAGFKTYQHLIDMAKPVLEAGISVILDATFLAGWQRGMFGRVANSLGIRMFILDFKASDKALISRLRQRESDASEATIEVLQHQQKTAEPLLDYEKTYTITVDTESNDGFTQLVASLKAIR